MTTWGNPRWTSWFSPPDDTFDIESYASELEAAWEDCGSFAELAELSEPDDAEAIERSFIELARYNQLESHFNTGRVLGRILCDCHRCEHSTRGWEYDADLMSLNPGEIGWSTLIPETFFQRYERNLEELLKSPNIDPCGHGRLMLEHDRARCREDQARVSALFDERGSELGFAANRLAEIRVAVGMALGELVGLLRHADNEACLKDAASPVPRMFALSKQASMERVGGQLLVIQRELNERTSTGMLPENVVAMLGNAIEVIARQVWPREFAAMGTRSDFGRLLDEKGRSPDALEQRLARVAMTLYRQYRVPAEHAGPTFRCSYEEARFFFNGIRVLEDLRRRIIGGKNK